MVDGSSMIGFPLVIADSERDIPGIEPGPLGWYTSALTTGLQEVFVSYYPRMDPHICLRTFAIKKLLATELLTLFKTLTL